MGITIGENQRSNRLDSSQPKWPEPELYFSNTGKKIFGTSEISLIQLQKTSLFRTSFIATRQFSIESLWNTRGVLHCIILVAPRDVSPPGKNNISCAAKVSVVLLPKPELAPVMRTVFGELFFAVIICLI
jgi:hypothetical protein